MSKFDDPGIQIGDSVYLKKPGLNIECTSLVGDVVDVVEHNGIRYCIVHGSTGKHGGGGYNTMVAFPDSMWGHRSGTPINQISGNPDHPGYGNWLRISRSWGYD